MQRLRRAASGWVLVLLVCGCSQRDEPATVLAREEHLRRQIEDLRFLVERAEKGALVPRDGAVIAVGEDLAQRLLRLALPREFVLRERFRVRLESAEVRFRDGHGAVRFESRLTWTHDADLYDADVSAEASVFARIETVSVHPREGVLLARIVPIGFEIRRLTIGEDNRGARRLAEGVGAQMAESLSALAFPLTIPVAIERDLGFAGVEQGALRLRASTVPLRAVVRDASAHGGRLWIVLQVEAGR